MRNAADIIMDTAQSILVDGMEMGYTAAEAGSLALTIVHGAVEIRAPERGITVIAALNAGVSVSARLFLAQFNQSTFQAAFPDSGGVFSIHNNATGTPVKSVSFQFIGNKIRLSGQNVWVRKSSDPTSHTLFQENTLALDLTFMPDGSGEIARYETL
jgi:hypothetical protein